MGEPVAEISGAPGPGAGDPGTRVVVGTGGRPPPGPAGRRGGVPRRRPGAAGAPLPGRRAGPRPAGQAARLVGGKERGGRVVCRPSCPATRWCRPPCTAIPAGRRGRGGPPGAAALPARRRAGRGVRPGGPAFVEALGAPLGVEVLGPADGRWLVRAPRPPPCCATPWPPPSARRGGCGWRSTRPASERPTVGAVRTIDWAGRRRGARRPDRAAPRGADPAHHRRGRPGRCHPPPGGAGRAGAGRGGGARRPAGRPPGPGRGLGRPDAGAAVATVRHARPTAANLAWGVDRVAARLPEGEAAVEAEARAVLEEDVATNRAMGERGADLLEELCATRRRCGSTPTATPGPWPAWRWARRWAWPGRCRPGPAGPRSTPTRPARCSRAAA